MNKKTILSAQYNGHRYQLIEVSYSSEFVTYSILQDRKVVKSRLMVRKCAMMEFISMLRWEIINNEIA